MSDFEDKINSAISCLDSAKYCFKLNCRNDAKGYIKTAEAELLRAWVLSHTDEELKKIREAR